MSASSFTSLKKKSKECLFIFVSATNRHRVYWMFTSLLGECIDKTPGSGEDGTCLVVYKPQHPGARQWVPAHPTAPQAAARQPQAPAGSAEGAGIETGFYLFGKHSNTMEMKATEAPR